MEPTDNRNLNSSSDNNGSGVPLVTLSTPGILNPDGTQAQVPMNQTGQINLEQPLKWQAQEYIAAQKNVMWYVVLVLVVIGVVALDFFVIKSFTISILAVAIAAVLITMSVRPAPAQDYTLTTKQITINSQTVNLSDYKAFGMIHDGKENSLILIPKKRFQASLSVYFPAEISEQIVAIIGSSLPVQKIEPDFIDKLVRLLRF